MYRNDYDSFYRPTQGSTASRPRAMYSGGEVRRWTAPQNNGKKHRG